MIESACNLSVKVVQPCFRGIPGKRVCHSTPQNFNLPALVFVLILCAAQARSWDQQNPVLGRAGDLSITEREFRERFQLSPGLHRQGANRLDTAKLEFLHSMIAEKVLSQEALARGLDADSPYRRALSEITKQRS